MYYGLGYEAVTNSAPKIYFVSVWDGFDFNKKSGDTKGAFGLGAPKAHADEKAEQKRTEKKIMESSFPMYL